MKWFNGCTTAEAVKKMYRDLCKAYHPDLHPGEANETAMKEINAEYDIAWARYKNVHGTADNGKGNSLPTLRTPQRAAERLTKRPKSSRRSSIPLSAVTA